MKPQVQIQRFIERMHWLPCLIAALVSVSCNGEKLSPLELTSTATAPRTFTLKINNYCSRSGFNPSDFYLVPMSYHIIKGVIEDDFDRDGLSNSLDSDIEMGLNKYQADSNGDGYSDLLVFRAGFDLTSQQSLAFCADTTADTDKDGFTDCEESGVTHTEPLKWDTDGDRIPDHLEVFAGLDPKDSTDGDANPSGDGLSNREKIKFGLPIAEQVTDEMKVFQLNYETNQKSPACSSMVVRNVAKSDFSGGNQVNLYFIENQSLGSSQALKIISVVIEQLTESEPGVFEYNYEKGDASSWAIQ